MQIAMEYLHIDDATIEYEVHGSGDPVLLIPLSLIADGLGRPLFSEPELASHYQLIHYHRRGWMGSTRGHSPLTIELMALDAAALLRHLDVKQVHVAGHSIGAIIALQLTLDEPNLVHTLSLLEPPLRMGAAGKDSFERIIVPMLNAYREGDKQKAVEIFSNAVFGPDWKLIIEKIVPGGVDQAVVDFDTFIQEQPAINSWQFDASKAARITQPALSVMGTRSPPLAAKSRELLHSWFS
ncbi:MAG TPA: alpha/beta hydrolase, partial [Ktedonobacteraceae bacterium]|nr:alpha/beta hydrolase [Ktedonobacteraceae bacterium]